MPVGIAAADKKLLMIAGGLLSVLLAASVIFTPPPEQMTSKVPSTYSAQSSGARAAYQLLASLHYPVRRWQSPPTELDTDAGNVLLILAEPSQPPSANERKALEQFVVNGGHVLFTGGNIQTYFANAEVSSENVVPAWRTFTPNIPSGLTRGAPQVTIEPQAYWTKLLASQLSLYGEADSPAVVSWLLGDGEIIWWAGSTPLSNAGISHENNLRLFLNAADNWSVDEPYEIYWDEYFHGERSSLWSYVEKTSLAWGALQIALLVAAVLFAFARRSGPVHVPAEISRLSPLEFVDTLGGLYERAGAAPAAVSISHSRLRSLLTRQLALPSSTPDAELALAAEQRLGWKGSSLRDTLLAAGAAGSQERLRPRKALELVQKLELFSAKLDVGARHLRAREKT